MRVVLGLGSNVGDRADWLRRAIDGIRGLPKTGGLRLSEVYETAPLDGGPVQGAYFNMAVLIDTELEPAVLLEQLLSVERSLGRVRAERWGPRTIDIDILWVEGVAIDSESLTVPHPGLLGRAFAVQPLLALVPDATDPGSGRRIAEIAEADAVGEVMRRVEVLGMG